MNVGTYIYIIFIIECIIGIGTIVSDSYSFIEKLKTELMLHGIVCIASIIGFLGYLIGIQ